MICFDIMPIPSPVLILCTLLGDRQVLQEMHHISWFKYGKQ